MGGVVELVNYGVYCSNLGYTKYQMLLIRAINGNETAVTTFETRQS